MKSTPAAKVKKKTHEKKEIVRKKERTPVKQQQKHPAQKKPQLPAKQQKREKTNQNEVTQKFKQQISTRE